MKQSLSPRELARVVGVSESSLKRWADDGRLCFTRTAGGHRRISVPEAVRFARRSDLPIVCPELLGLPGGDPDALDPAAANSGRPASEASAVSADPVAVLAELLRHDQPGLARSLVVGLFLRGQPLSEIFDTVVGPALNGFGELWRRDATGIYLEHRAFDICVQAVNELRSLIPPPPDDAPVAVGGSPSGDIYLMPSLMAAAVLADAGYRAVNLGPQLPLDSLAAAAAHYDASVVWLACACIDHAPDEAGVRGLAANLEQRGSTLLLGGNARPRGLKAANTVHVSSMSELTAFAAGALSEPRSEPRSESHSEPRSGSRPAPGPPVPASADNHASTLG